MQSIENMRRQFMLEMIDELRNLTQGTWACVLMKMEISSLLQGLGGIAGEW
ncbi:hypothetical protein LJR230_000414 [Trinickia sp. LjRoot230]|uniref:hypothetical protein n=1 Tax=Trinickia sp. LjRoot230 TaxID=3342288 RepID=UPI003ECC2045